MEQYLPIVALAVLGLLFIVISLVVSRFLAPSRMSPAKSAPYESGITDQVSPPQRFPVRFYLIAMLFIMFDIEIVFLYPWAVANDELGAFGLGAMLLFAAIFFLSFVYELGTGGLNWGPTKRQVVREARSPARTSTTTVRRVGLEGRPVVPGPGAGEAA